MGAGLLSVPDTLTEYHLKGIVYYGAFHFTSQIVTSDSLVWFHDGQLGANCQYENHLNDFDELELRSCGTQKISLVVYAD